ncbi:MAG: hypothetical protein ACO3JH_08300, partial [Flavobacteriaceae bacterium]
MSTLLSDNCIEIGWPFDSKRDFPLGKTQNRRTSASSGVLTHSNGYSFPLAESIVGTFPAI